jgi:calcineurin-like phosphoesterase
MVNVAIAGEPEVTVPVPCATPSIRNDTVPVGLAETGLVDVMAAETTSEPPAVGVRLAGVMTVVVGLLPTVTVTAADTDEA